MGDVIVSMEHITKEFPGVKALDDVKFNLRSGEVMALLGDERRRKINTDENSEWCLFPGSGQSGNIWKKIFLSDAKFGAGGRGCHYPSGAEYVQGPDCCAEYVPGS